MSRETRKANLEPSLANPEKTNLQCMISLLKAASSLVIILSVDFLTVNTVIIYFTETHPKHTWTNNLLVTVLVFLVIVYAVIMTTQLCPPMGQTD